MVTSPSPNPSASGPQRSPQAAKPVGKPPSKPKKKRRFGWFLNLLLFVGLILVGWLFYQAEQKRGAAEEELQRTASQLEELRQASQNSNAEIANRVLENIRKHIEITGEIQPTVATITDVDRLRETNQFYQKAENGDHLIITEDRAILYDSDRDLILDVVPVRIDQTQQQQANGSPNPSASPSPGAEGESPSPSPAQ